MGSLRPRPFLSHRLLEDGILASGRLLKDGIYWRSRHHDVRGNWGKQNGGRTADDEDKKEGLKFNTFGELIAEVAMGGTPPDVGQGFGG
jgi:hypothetical protein